MASVQSRVFNGVVRYRVRFRGTDGKQRSKSFGSKRDAIAFAAKVEVQVREGDWIDPNAGRETFGELHARWVAARTVSPVRAATEETQANVHILPRWKCVPLKKIKPLDVQEWIKNLTSPRLDAAGHRKPASAYTAEGALLQLSVTLEN